MKGLAKIALLAGFGIGLSVIAQAQKSALAAVNLALQNGEADEAFSLLGELPADDAASAEAHNLRCRVLFTLEQWEKAADECEQAIRLDGQSSDYHMWFGRALGEWAGSASFINAYNLAKRSRSEFEQSVQLNPRNAEALADLGEFYNSAPGVVGGGTTKAEGVAAQLDHVDPARAHELRAGIAEGNKDYTTAEREYRAALAASQHPAFQWVRLGSFMRRRKRWDEMLAAIRSGQSAAERDRHAGVALYNGATVLARAQRNWDLAAKLLDAYLAGPVKTEEAPAFAAHVLRARAAAQLGDAATAKSERAAALALAHDYKPARDLKF